MAQELVAPVLLLAMPQVRDPFFYHSVVLLLAHGEEGSLGLVVNRPATLPLADLLRDMKLDWRGDQNAHAFVGGPVQPQTGTVLYRHAREADPLDGHGAAIVPGLALTQQLSDLERLAREPPLGLRLLLGYAGWSAGQLMEELLRNDWLTAPVDLDLIFHSDSAGVWAHGLRSVGVDPAALPTVTPNGATAN